MTWAVYEHDGTIDVVPLNDIKLHITGMECRCNPRRDDERQDIVIHAAYDGREKYEPDHEARKC